MAEATTIIHPMDYAKLDQVVNPVVALLFFATVAIFIILSFVLDYHVRMYSTSLLKLATLRLIYFGFSGFLLVIMAFALLYLYP